MYLQSDLDFEVWYCDIQAWFDAGQPADYGPFTRYAKWHITSRWKYVKLWGEEYGSECEWTIMDASTITKIDGPADADSGWQDDALINLPEGGYGWRLYFITSWNPVTLAAFKICGPTPIGRYEWCYVPGVPSPEKTAVDEGAVDCDFGGRRKRVTNIVVRAFTPAP
jgi:hypothetical protein